MRRFAELWISVGLSCAALVFAGCGEDSDAGVGGNEPASCGDEVREGDEECDDGDEDDENECNNDCELNCGDGDVEGDEECDDGNSVNGDACTNQCVMGTGGSGDDDCGDGVLQAGEACDDGNNSNTDACTIRCQGARCGDGYVQPGEACDDADTDDEDACTTECRSPTCGDGVVDEGEECDDENDDDTDECTSNCLDAICGDGFVQGDEECDDANTSNGDLCTNECFEAICGDGFRQPGEACDDGNDDDADECTTNCALPTCGDGEVQEGEECDDGNDDEIDCTDRCIVPGCGDGIVTEDEDCDDANESNADNCTNACTSPRCGDGFVQSGEQCDMGEANGDEGSPCTIACATEIDSGGGCPPGGVRCVEFQLQECDGTMWEVVENCIGICRNGGCVDLCVENEVQIDDGDPCTDDGCDPRVGVGEHDPIDGTPPGDPLCSDGDPCTDQDACEAGTCVGVEIVCQALDECHDPGTCTDGVCDNPVVGENTECTDLDLCTAQAFCNETGACVDGEPLDISDDNPCTNDSCEPSTGDEAHDFQNDTGCEVDQDLCTLGTCVYAEQGCVEVDIPPVDDGLTCTTDTCNPDTGGTEYENVTGECPNGCGECEGDQCVGTPEEDDNPCTTVFCTPEGETDFENQEPGTVVEGCGGDDDDFCDGKEACDVTGEGDEAVAFCNDTYYPELNEDDNQSCTLDFCNATNGQITHEPVDAGEPCGEDGDDGNPCTNDVCSGQGTCSNVPQTGPPVVEAFTPTPFATTSSNKVVSLPASADENAVGDLLLLFFANDDDDTVSLTDGITTGWSTLFSEEHDEVRLTVLARVWTGTEVGTTVTLTTSPTGEQAAAHVYRISEGTWEGIIGGGTEGIVDDNGDTSSSVFGEGNPGWDVNPDSLSTPGSWGDANTLWFAIGAHDLNDALDTGQGENSPVNYQSFSMGPSSSDRTQSSGNSGSATLLSAFRAASVGTENPGDWDIGCAPESSCAESDARDWVAGTVAVRGYCQPFLTCPVSEPDDNDSCTNRSPPFGLECEYDDGGTLCTCTGPSGVWDCVGVPQ